MKGIIAMINKKYVILNDRQFIDETKIPFILLPHDVVSYNVINNKIIIDSYRNLT